MKELRVEFDEETFKALTEECNDEKRAKKYQVNISLKEYYKITGRIKDKK